MKKVLFATCFLSLGVWAGAGEIIGSLQKADACLQTVDLETTKDMSFLKSSLPTENPLSDLQKYCSADELTAIGLSFDCMSAAICGWAEQMNTFIAAAKANPIQHLFQMPLGMNTEACPKPTFSRTSTCNKAFGY